MHAKTNRKGFIDLHINYMQPYDLLPDHEFCLDVQLFQMKFVFFLLLSPDELTKPILMHPMLSSYGIVLPGQERSYDPLQMFHINTIANGAVF
jgi:hypothetical protein